MHDEDQRIARLLKGDERAAEEIVAAYQRLLRFVVRRMDVPDAVADDVIQNIWMDAWRQLRAGRFRGECPFGRWLARIAEGKVVDYRRRRDSSRSSSMVALEPPGWDAGGVAEPGDQEALVAAEEAITSMDERLQLAFRLRHREGWEVPAIAKALGLSPKRTYALLDGAQRLFCAAILGTENVARPKRLRERKDARVRRDGALSEPPPE